MREFVEKNTLKNLTGTLNPKNIIYYFRHDIL